MTIVAVTGAKTTIAQAFIDRLPEGETVQRRRIADLGVTAHRYLICTGFLAGKKVGDLSPEEQALTWDLNFAAIARALDLLFAVNQQARVVVIGSESGFSGSYDMAYAGAKAAMHRYIESKPIGGQQMLVGLAPHIILDSAMTQRRDDLERLEQRAEANRLGRWLNPIEVAREARHLLYEASLSLSGQVIRMRP